MEAKLVAPEVDRLLRAFERGHVNPGEPTAAVAAAVERLLGVLADLAPMESNDEARAIWIRVPRGTIDDYDGYDDMLGWGEVSSREEYEAMWREDYPEEAKWYRLVVVEECDFRGVAVDDRTVVSAWAGDGHGLAEADWLEVHKVSLLGLLGRAAGESMGLVRSGAYGREVESSLPYWQRKGVVRRSDVWRAFPEAREAIFEGMPDGVFERFRELAASGAAERAEGRMASMTAGDFLGACALGYRACGYDLKGEDGAELVPAALYRRFADGRDEGLVGGGHGMNAGPALDPDDPEAWDAWYFDRFEGCDYVGIVPRRVIPAYCADMFPARFGKILDFTHVYDEDVDAYGDAIEWLPVEPARLAVR